jgi:hypothetical protein
MPLEADAAYARTLRKLSTSMRRACPRCVVTKCPTAIGRNIHLAAELACPQARHRHLPRSLKPMAVDGVEFGFSGNEKIPVSAIDHQLAVNPSQQNCLRTSLGGNLH